MIESDGRTASLSARVFELRGWRDRLTAALELLSRSKGTREEVAEHTKQLPIVNRDLVEVEHSLYH